MRKMLVAFVTVGLAVPAFAASDKAPASAQPEKPKKEKKICRHIDTTESRMGRVECKTAAEWDTPTIDDTQKLPNQH